MLKPDLDERSYGSTYDPLLNGVAQGLARLFPPVETRPRPERGHASPQPPSRKAASGRR